MAPSLEQDVVARLTAAGRTLATAESCTGGLLAARLTAVPGASAVFRGGVVAYDNAVKRDLLAVPASLLDSVGAVSAEVAAAMAQGARKHLGCEYALATTGIAGPGGATTDKPVGLVFIALAGPGAACRVQRLQLAGDRQAVREQSVRAALAWLLQALAESPP